MSWSLAHATRDAGLDLSMKTGCAGTFRIVDDDHKRPATACCDVCGERLGVKQKELGAVGERDQEPMDW